MIDWLRSSYDWIVDNKEWLFSGAGVSIISFFLWYFFHPKTRGSNLDISDYQPQIIEDSNLYSDISYQEERGPNHDVDLCILKSSIHILFIDDDQKFKVVDILRKSGWVHTRRTSDLASLDDPQVELAQILFIDIHGVGRRLRFKDEGLGLASAILDKYPEKKVVIYSAQTQGERFHPALKKADECLPKNADPYEFQQATERLAKEIFNKL